MAEPEEIQFACIGCGAMNPAGAEACSGCGHRFGGPGFVPASASASAPLPAPGSGRSALPPPVRFLDPFDPPVARVARTPTFRIGTAMGVIAVVGVGLGAFAASPYLGYLVAVGLVPATIRTILVAGRREAEGRPMRPADQSMSFLLTFGAVYLILVASLIAFGVTCIPIGSAMSNTFPGGLWLAFGVGLIAAALTATGLAWGMLKASRDRDRKQRDRDLTRWR
jgi:hypothetical protein